MPVECQNCHKQWVPGQAAGLVNCPECGAGPDRQQPSSVHPEMELRDMVDPGFGPDAGGNPLQEGILGDYQNKWVRDESFASVHSQLGGGVRTSSPEEFARNKQIFHQLKATGEPRGHQLNWTPGMRGRGLFLGNYLHTWNTMDPDNPTTDEFLNHHEYATSKLGDPQHVDFNTGVEIDPDGGVVPLGKQDPSRHIEIDPRLFVKGANQPSDDWSFTANQKPDTFSQHIELPWGITAADFDLQNADVIPPGDTTVEALPHQTYGIHGGPASQLRRFHVLVNGSPMEEEYTPRSPHWQPNTPVTLTHPNPGLLNLAKDVVESGNEVPLLAKGQEIGGNSFTDQVEVHPNGFSEDVINGLGKPDNYINGRRVRETARELHESPHPGTVTVGAANPEALEVAKRVLSEGSSNALHEHTHAEKVGAGGTVPVPSDINQYQDYRTQNPNGPALGPGGATGPLLGIAGLAALPFALGAGGAAEGAEAASAEAPAAASIMQKAIQTGKSKLFGGGVASTAEGFGAKQLGKQFAKGVLFGAGKGLLNGEGDSSNPASATPVTPARDLQQIARQAADYDSPVTNPDIGIKDDDPESVDPHELNVGDNKNYGYEPGGDYGGSDTYGAHSPLFDPAGEGYSKLHKALPNLIDAIYSDESGLNDPVIRDLHETLEREKPGYLRFADPGAELHIIDHHGKHSAMPVTPPNQFGQPLNPLNPQANPAVPNQAPTQVGNSATCPACGGVLDANGSCPQCGYGAQQTAQPQMSPGHVPNPNQFASSVHEVLKRKAAPLMYEGTPDIPEGLTIQNYKDYRRHMVPQQKTQFVPCPTCGEAIRAGYAICPHCHNAVGHTSKTAEQHAGPQTPEQVAAVVQWLEENHRGHEAPEVTLNPTKFADILALLQNNPNGLPQPDPTAPGQVPPPQPPPAMPPMDPSQGPPQMQAAVKRYAADSLAPKCPKCHSHTTSLLNSDGDCRCHACGNLWNVEGHTDDMKKSKISEALEQPTETAHELPNLPDEQATTDDRGDDTSTEGTWKTADGSPLRVGDTYKLVNPKFAIPDIIKVESVKPDGVDFVIEGLSGIAPRAKVTRDEAQLENLQFEHYDPDNPQGQTKQPPLDPGLEQNNDDNTGYTGPAQDDLSSPHYRSKVAQLPMEPEVMGGETPVVPCPCMGERHDCPACHGSGVIDFSHLEGWNPRGWNHDGYESVQNLGGPRDVATFAEGTGLRVLPPLTENGPRFQGKVADAVPGDEGDFTKLVGQERYDEYQFPDHGGEPTEKDLADLVEDANHAAAEQDLPPVEACQKCSSTTFSSDMISPEETEHSCYKCGNTWIERDADDTKLAGIASEESRSWVLEGDDGGAFMTVANEPGHAVQGSRSLADIASKNKYAGYKYTPRQQRDLIDETGNARNMSKLNLEGTHYLPIKDPDKGNALEVPDDHMGIY